MPNRDEILQKAGELLEDAIANKVKDNKFKQEREYLVERVSKEISSTFKPFLDDIRATLKRAVDDIKVTIPPIEVPEAKIPDIHIPEIKIPDIVVPSLPEIKLPTIVVPEVKIPEIKLPTINVPEPKVTVHVPAFPEIKWPKSNLPVEGWLHLMGVDLDHPLPVQIRDKDGKPFNPFAELTQVIGGGGGFRQVSVDDYLGSTIPITQVSGAIDSVNIQQIAGNPAVVGSGFQDNALRVVHATDATVSVNIVSEGVTLDVKQVSGANWSVSTIPLGYSWLNITGATTSTVVKSGAGVLHTICINKRGTGSVCNVWGDLVGEGSAIASLDTTLSVETSTYDVAFTSGLTVSTTGAAGADLTITYT